MDGISADDLLLIVGDFNARVGCGERGDSWAGVHGCHVNDNGEALLSWCAQNGLAVMSFRRRGYTNTHGSTQEANSDIVLIMC